MIAAEVAISPVFTWLLEHGWQVLVVFLFPAVKRWFDARATEANAGAAQSEAARISKLLAEAVMGAVAVVDRDYKPKLVAAMADGKLTDAEKAMLRAEAIRIAKETIAPEVLELARAQFGEAGLVTLLVGLVERFVTERRSQEGWVKLEAAKAKAFAEVAAKAKGTDDVSALAAVLKGESL